MRMAMFIELLKQIKCYFMSILPYFIWLKGSKLKNDSDLFM